MIYAYTGLPGSGKTLHATRTVLRRIWRRRCTPAVTTWQLALADAPADARRHWHYVAAGELSPAALSAAARDYWRLRGRAREGELLLAIDEAHVLLGARQWCRKDRQSWVSWLAQHRHEGWDVILIAQSLKAIDSQVRAIVDDEVRHVRIDRWLPIPMPWPVILAVGHSPTAGLRTGTQLIVPWPRILRAYDTMAIADEVTVDRGSR